MTDPAPDSPCSDRIAAPVGVHTPEPGPQRLWALVPCAGTGLRAGAASPKQYQPIAGQALVLHTLAAFAAVARISRTVVAVAAGDDFFARLAAPPARPWTSVACGGATRAQTVANGLAVLRQLGAAENDWVLVHDAARCLVTPELINRLIDACVDDAVGGLLAHPVPDTLKLAADGRVVRTPDRSHQWLAQTPQMFRLGVLARALLAAGEGVTDESSAMEAMGLSPKLVSGSALNFKVTYAEDFVLAQAVLSNRLRAAGKDMDYDYP